MKKKSIYCLLAVILCSTAFGQQTNLRLNPPNAHNAYRCYTMEALTRYRAEQKATPPPLTITSNGRLNGTTGTTITSGTPENAGTGISAKLNTTVFIPIVFHIVLDDPKMISDQDVRAQVAKLNIDFAGLNADSINIPPAFKAVFGKSKIQFVLAKTDPAGNLTNGIERVASATKAPLSLSNPVKHTNQGGLDAWDPTKYVNVWAADAQNAFLGLATLPGTVAASEEGIIIDYQGFGLSSCYTDPSFALGRTLVHEMGHYFGLFHTWGDDDQCAGDDFQQLSGSTYSFPTGLYNPAGQGNTAGDVGDTPNQAGSTSGCPGGGIVKTDACNSTSPGIMYQNYMDYTDDPCYAMFTTKQVERMEYALENFRTSLLTSTRANAPAGTPLYDVAITEVINPGGTEMLSCKTYTYSKNLTCPGPLTARILITNKGTATLTSIKAGVIVNNGAPIIGNYPALNLKTGESVTLILPASTSLPLGNSTLKFFTSSPNGFADQNTSNDTATYQINVATVNGNLVEGFEQSTFPPEGWTLINPDNSRTWERLAGSFGLAGSNGTVGINLYNYPALNQVDILQTPSLNTAITDSLQLSFDYAYALNANGTTDTLTVVVTTDCGQTFQEVAKLWGTTLATVSGTPANFIPSLSGDWRNLKLDLSSYLQQSTKIAVGFKSTNEKGNNLFIDNVNIQNLLKYDLAAVKFNLADTEVCGNIVSPSVLIQNLGTNLLTSYIANYRIDGGAVNSQLVSNIVVPRNGTTIYNFPSLNLPTGTHSILFYTSNPNGQPDKNTVNDTLRINITTLAPMTAPFAESFEGPAFPPPGWTIHQLPVDNITWTQTTVAAYDGVASAYMNNYNYPANGRVDELLTPPVQYSGDSVFVKFDLAAATYSYPGSTNISMDTLEVLVTADCG
ncbi:MAG: type sorting protein [Chitinophagaceae bacterium]|nr:type sorting protein [Chitinophagaceae bacterium]